VPPLDAALLQELERRLLLQLRSADEAAARRDIQELRRQVGSGSAARAA
jgi:hypothetical protein